MMFELGKIKENYKCLKKPFKISVLPWPYFLLICNSKSVFIQKPARVNFLEDFNKSSMSPIDNYQVTRFKSSSSVFLEPDTLAPKYSINKKIGLNISKILQD